MSKFDTKEEYSLFAQIKTAYGMEKKGNSYLYLDDLTVKTTKTQTVTYNNKTTYNYLEGFNYYDGYENDKTLTVSFIKI
jgi:hypothetical protein